jgi:hypothetical protein
MEINKFQMKRVNPFQGLVIDADTWKDAHNYHRENMKLHIFAFHKEGIVRGLEVTANNPPDTSVNISPGIAIDTEGNVIIMPLKQRYVLQTHEKRTIYLVIQFREIPGEPFQPPEGGQPTRIVEAYRVQERDALPSEPYVELCRIDYDPAIDNIKNTRNPVKPSTNEINLRYREEAAKTPAETSAIPPRESTPISSVLPSREAAPAVETSIVGYLPLTEAKINLHKRGLFNLMSEINRRSGTAVTFEEVVNLKKSFGRYSLIYITGSGRFDLSSEQQSALLSYLQSGGVIFGDGCSGEADGKGAKEFGLAFNRLASQFNCKLGIVQRGHALLAAENIFSEVPPGCDPPMLLEGGNMICSSSDYGCAWEGGHSDHPLSREIIRSSIEIGVNIVSFAVSLKAKK